MRLPRTVMYFSFENACWMLGCHFFLEDNYLIEIKDYKMLRTCQVAWIALWKERTWDQELKCSNLHVCSVVSDFSSLWTVAHQAPLSMGLWGKSARVGCYFYTRASSQPREWACVSCAGRQVFFTIGPPALAVCAQMGPQQTREDAEWAGVGGCVECHKLPFPAMVLCAVHFLISSIFSGNQPSTWLKMPAPV